jgi:tRNA (adenine58-N1)-methyltransferase non-catalytic subunit
LENSRLIHLGKYGSFKSNQILGRPYHLSFEILDKSDIKDERELRIVPAAELHAAALLEEVEGDGSMPGADVDDFGLMNSTKTNVNILDEPTNQRLTMAEIEALKQDEMGTTRELIAKIMDSHSTLDQKTAFSLAKYTLKKHKKYTKRFTVLPLDVTTLTDWMMADREVSKIMEIRNETLGLIGCWGNVHAVGNHLPDSHPSCRYLVVDDTGGLLVAALAERMGILHQTDLSTDAQASESEDEGQPSKPKRSPAQSSATSNTITLIHSNQQPNLSLLRYFNYDYNNPSPNHPLHTHLSTLCWLQLLDPNSDSTYTEPPVIPQSELSTMKSNRRSNYFRKRRRWAQTKTIVDRTREGGFNGLIVASHTNPTTILRHCVPLLAGSAQAVVYSPHIEPLSQLVDAYSTARRSAFLNTPEGERKVPSDDFPVDPTLLLVPMVQTSRVRKWQVLPGRTHPLMMGRGGAEGYVFVATRVVPAQGKVEARGRQGKKRKEGEANVNVKAELNDEDVEDEEGRKEGKRVKVEDEREGEVEVTVDAAVKARDKQLNEGLDIEPEFEISAKGG